LTDLCRTENLLDGMRYYQFVHEVCLANPNTGKPDERVLSILQELEEYEVTEWGAPIKLSPRVITALDLDPNLSYCAGSTGYDNWSQHINVPGLDDSRQRSLVWGELYAALRKPFPIRGTDSVMFEMADDVRSWAS
jgi:hypothetical protein